MAGEGYQFPEAGLLDLDPPAAELDPYGDLEIAFAGMFYTYGYKENRTLPRNPALTPAQADEPCNRYTPESLLKELNKLTGYHLDMSEPNVDAGLHILISGNHDVGKAYAWFRTAFVFTPSTRLRTNVRRKAISEGLAWIAWYSGLPDISNCDYSLTSVDQPGVDAVDKRETAIQDIDGELRIINPDFYHPRRLWDILANRVIPYEWHARTTRMFKLNIQLYWQALGVEVIRGSAYLFGCESDRPPPHKEFNAEYVKRLAEWKQTAFEGCVPYAAISHSWAANLKYVLSPVNNKMWPIPLPADIELEAVRQNLLEFRFPEDRLHRPHFWEVYAPPYEVEYCWLDILCLRQAWVNSSDGLLTEPAHPLWRQQEKTRLEEWAIDVPTIGSIYHRSSDILLYLNGIGRPVSLAKEDWESPYHWINRAWTLQEFSSLRGLGHGGKYGIVMHMDKPQEGRQYTCSMATLGACLPFRNTYRIHRRLPNVDVNSGRCIVRLINTIVRRHASNETDKIAGLLFLIGAGGALPHFPIYKPGEDIESAWLRLVNTFHNSWRWSLSIHCPQFPDQLFPTWRSLCNVLLNSPKPGLWLITTDWDGPGQFAISSSTPLENAQPLVGIQPLACLLTTIGEQVQVPRTLQIPRDEARGIKLDYTVSVAQWYLSPRARPNSGEIYYLIPLMLLRPLTDSSEPRCSDWVAPFFEEPAYFLVCEPLLDEKSSRDNWDGIAFKKLGFTWIKPIGPLLDHDYWFNGLERDQPFWRFFDSVYTADLIPLVMDIGRMTPRAMKEKYGKEKVYTLIY